MPASSRDRISVDLQGLKAALFNQARVRGVSPSDFVRHVLIDVLSRSDPLAQSRSLSNEFVSTQARVRLSLRMTRDEAGATLAAAAHAGLTPGVYVAGLVAGIPALNGGASRADHVAALIASSAELSTLTRNIHHLTALLRQGHVQAAQEYREMLDTLAGDVRSHLTLASGVLADLQPRRQRAETLKHPTT